MSGSKTHRTLKRCLGCGPYDVDVLHNRILYDPRRDKEIPLRIYAPVAAGPHPLVLYSHGAGDSNATSPALLRHWASHGYAVIAPTHLFGDRPLIERSLARLREELMRPREMGPEAWRARTGDLVAVMDRLQTLIAEVPMLSGRIDTGRIAIGGHSFGAYTAMLLGGATLTDKSSGEVFRFEDRRPRCVMIISGPGRDNMGLNDRSWDECTRPMMVMAGSRDPGYMPGFSPRWRIEPFAFSPPGDKYLLYMRGAHHLSYIGPVIDISLTDPMKRGRIAKTLRKMARMAARVAPVLDQTGLFDYARIASVAFWDAYLKGDAEARAFLQSRALEAYSGHVAQLSHR